MPIKDLIKDTMVTVGPSVTLTSVTNFAGFMLGYIIPYPAFRQFVIEVQSICKQTNNLILFYLHT